jgi:hypothetical protein
MRYRPTPGYRRETLKIIGQMTQHPEHSIDHAVASDTTSRTLKACLFPAA